MIIAFEHQANKNYIETISATQKFIDNYKNDGYGEAATIFLNKLTKEAGYLKTQIKI